MDHVAIVIVDYNSIEDTRECLQSLLKIKHQTFKYSVIVVDNGSKELFSLPPGLKADNIEILRSESNLGFTGGNNLGLRYAVDKLHPDYLLLLNNDTLVDPDFLEKMMERIRSDVSIGLVGAKTYFVKDREYHLQSYDKSELGNVIWFAGGSIDWPNLAAFHRGVDEVDRGQFDDLDQTDFVTGCTFLMPISVLERVGYLDEKYFLYLEDVDYSQRVKQAGYRLSVCSQALVWHKNAGSSGGAGSLVHRYYQTRNRLFFGWKYSDRFVKIIVIRLLLISLLSGGNIERRAVYDLLMGNMGKQPLV